ncbi:MAG TPA: farnesyl diphosphate synthase [Parachlamydiaceae bacterium]|nr:farnesyl diphosphate synthase [Parachlamydiaceae bacterium]
MDIDLYLKDQASLVEEKLNTLVPEKEEAYALLFEAARYSLLGGGKRLRPALTIATAETFGKSSESALSAACALEMIHTYSLIHDDLPCMDNDDFRRGKPSLHKAYSEGHAVLTGDYLLTYAFEVVVNDPALSSQQKVALISLLAKNSGCQGMIAGQVMDIQAEGKEIGIDLLKHIHRYKTGALINASILAGGIIASVSSEEFQLLNDFGLDIGLAFQIVDDVIDVTSSEIKHGKAVASDVANHKTTYVTLLGLQAAQEAADMLYERSLSHLSKIDRDTSLLEALAKRLVHRNR